MNKDDILIVKYPFRMTPNRVDMLRKAILEQKETGVIVLPDYCEVVVAPKDVGIKVEMDTRSIKTCGECKYLSLGEDRCINSMSPRSGTNKTTPACGCFEQSKTWMEE